MKNLFLNTTWGIVFFNFIVLPCSFLIFSESLTQLLSIGLSSDDAIETSIMVGMLSVLFLSLAGVIVNGYRVASTLRNPKDRDEVRLKLKFSISILGLLLYSSVLFYVAITMLL